MSAAVVFDNGRLALAALGVSVHPGESQISLEAFKQALRDSQTIPFPSPLPLPRHTVAEVVEALKGTDFFHRAGLRSGDMS